MVRLKRVVVGDEVPTHKRWFEGKTPSLEEKPYGQIFHPMDQVRLEWVTWGQIL